jgi:hypothetical protein
MLERFPRMILDRRMRKLAEGVRKIAMVVPLDWLAQINAWRRSQPDMPNVSEAIRRLVLMGLEAAAKGKKPKAKG